MPTAPFDVEHEPPAAAPAALAYDRSALLEVEIGAVEQAPATALVHPLSYASPRGGRVPALLVLPRAEGKHAAVLFLHHGGRQTTWQFLQEAGELALSGMASLFVDAPWLRREHQGKAAVPNAFRFFEQAAVDLMRGVEVLASLPQVDPERIAFVGHGFGAHLGAAVAAHAELRAVVLMAGSASMSRAMVEGPHPFWTLGGEVGPAALRAAAREMAGLDAERFIGRCRVPVFHQFGSRDPLVSSAMAHEYFALTPDPKVARFYEADHGLSEQARADRRAFLEQVLDVPRPVPVPPERVDPARLSQQLTSALPLHDPLADSAAVRVLRDRTYRSVDGHGYPLDVYQPTSAAPPRGRPAVVLVHGQAHPALLRDAKGWPALQGLARVLAARDLVAVVPNLGSTASGPSPEQCFSSIGRVADNVVAAVRHVQAHAVSLGVDRRRIALWVAGEGGLYGLGPALGRELNGSLVCAVALCPTLDETLFAHTRPPLSAGLIERLRPTAHLRRHGPRSLPILVVRAEHDRTEVNRALDAFVALAEQVQAPVTLLRHEHGHRGFEVVDATDETRDVLDRAFQFLETYL